MKRLGILLLALLLLSCSADPSVSTEPSPLSQETFVEEEGVLGILVDGKCHYTVIRPETCSETVRAAAQSLDTWMFYRLETHISVKNDFAAPTEREILVGNTNREETQSLLATLSEEEYAVGIVGKKLVICGHSEEAVEQAVRWFCKKYLKDIKLTEGQTPRWIVTLKEPYVGKVSS